MIRRFVSTTKYTFVIEVEQQAADEQHLHQDARLAAHVRRVEYLLAGLQDRLELGLEVFVVGHAPTLSESMRELGQGVATLV